MKNLSKIVLAGGLFLGACNQGKSSSTLTHEDFQRASWIEVPYEGEIWNSYKKEEGIVHGNANWDIYKTEVARKNHFRLIEKNKTTYIARVRGNSILLPDLDHDTFVGTRLGVYAAGTYQRDMQSNKGPE